MLSPRLIDEANQWWKYYNHIHQSFTSQSLSTLYDHPENFSPPMKNVKVDLKDGHILLNLEFDSEQTERNIKEVYTTDDEFLGDMLGLLDFLIRRITDYVQLKMISIEVKYKDTIYLFENIPLKDTKGRPYDRSDESESFVPLLKEKMKVIHSAE